jgi:glutathione S-transferase
MQGNIVTFARKSAGVPYPNAYATPQQAKENQDAYKFNCAQRAHANLLENMPQTIAYMLFAGLEYPTATAALGFGWLLSRSLYAYGYVQSNKRYAFGGWAFWLCQAGLWALCCATALKML